MIDTWTYKSERLLIKRVGDNIEYKIKVGETMKKDFIKKDFDFLNKYLHKINKIKKEDFEKNVFIQKGVKILFILIDSIEMKRGSKFPEVKIICCHKGKYSEIKLGMDYMMESAKYFEESQFKNLKIDIEKRKVISGKKMFIFEYKFDAANVKRIKTENIDYNADIEKNQLNIMDFI